MRNIMLIVVLLFVVGCETDQPVNFPANVYLVGEFTELEKADIQRGMSEWNDALVAPVLTLAGELPQRPQSDKETLCNSIYIVKERAPSGAPAMTRLKWCHAYIYFSPDAAKMVPQKYHYGMMAHEFGHVILWREAHSKDPHDLMYHNATPDTFERKPLISEQNIKDAVEKNESLQKMIDG